MGKLEYQKQGQEKGGRASHKENCDEVKPPKKAR